MPRPKKPIQLKIIEGTAKINRDRLPIQEPQYGNPGPLPPPDDLDDIGKAKWNEIYPQILEAGILKSTDLGSFKNYCQQWSVWTDAVSIIRSQGVVVEDLSGNQKKNPACTVLNEASKEIRALETLFGLNPSARGGLDVGKKKNESFDSRRR